MDGVDEGDTKQCGPNVSHFRSTSLKKTQDDLEKEWKQIICSPAILPVKKIRNDKGEIIYPEKDTMLNVKLKNHHICCKTFSHQLT